MKKLQLSPTLALPLEAAGQTIGILGIRGGGKTNTAGVIAEELLDAHIPICVIDPTDAWWGLRSRYPVVIFGGDHGDVPLLEESGKDVAEFIVRERQPVILSIQHLSHAAQRRFVADTLLELYRLKAKDAHRYPLTVLMDEAPLFIPQRVIGEAARCVGAVENLVARGRKSGFGVVLISQRSATINKDVLTQADTMIVHRLTGLPDRKVLAEWMDANATTGRNKETLADLAGLQKGDAWVWAPELDVYQRTHIRLRRTFDSSASPKIGKRLKPPKRMAKVDLKALGQKLEESVVRRKENDPASLRRVIADISRANENLTKQLAQAHLKADTKPGKTRTVKEHHEICPPGVVQGVERAAKELIGAGKVQIERGKAMLAQAKHLSKWPDRYTLETPAPAAAPQPHIVIHHPPATILPPKAKTPPVNGDRKLSSTTMKVLALLCAKPQGWTRVELGLLMAMQPSAGSFGNHIYALTGAGYAAQDGQRYVATDAGRALCPDVPPLTSEDLIAKWRIALKGNPLRVFNLALEQPGITREQMGAAMGMVHTAGSFGNHIYKVSGLNAIVRRGEGYYPADLFTGEGLN